MRWIWQLSVVVMRTLVFGILAFAGEPVGESRAASAARLRVQLVDDGAGPSGSLERAAQLERHWELHGVRVHPVLPSLHLLGRRSFDAADWDRLRALSRWYTVEVELEDLPAWWARVAADPGVIGPVVEPLAEAQAIFPDDPRLISQSWYLGLIGAPEAWETVRGQDGHVLVAVVDTGTDITHPDLAGNLWRNPGEIEGNGIDDDGNGFVDDIVGWNFALDVADPTGIEEQLSNRDHGTHVAGIIAAITDNAMGVAGIGFNPRLMAINAADPERDGFLRYGYDGIVYAALMGADVINCSWRTVRALPGAPVVVSPAFRDFENDVCEAAAALGSVVVAAAGNDASATAAPTPAFYPSVLAVTATRSQSQLLWSISNTGPWVDLAAPGEFIWSTLSTQNPSIDPYGPKSGTSMAAPIVAAAAALLKVQHPAWTPLQVRQRLRGTADSLVEIDLQRGAGAGSGLVRLDRAVGPTEVPGIHVGAPTLLDEDGDGVPEGGEEITLVFPVTSPFDFGGPVQISFSSDDAYVVPLEDRLRLARIDAGVTLDVRRGLTFYIRESVPAARIARIDFHWQTDEASGRDSHWVELLPIQASLSGGAVRMSAASNGKLGYADPTRSLLPSGTGLRADGSRSTSMVFGALLLGTGPEQVQNAVQAARPSSAFEDFRPEQEQSLTLSQGQGGGGTRQEILLRYSDNASANRLGAGVEQRVIGWSDTERGSFVISRWRVLARIESIENLHLGVLVDWSGADDDGRERVVLDAEQGMQWVEPASGSGAPWAGAILLEGPGDLRGDWLWALAPGDSLAREGRPTVYDVGNLDRKLSEAELWPLLSRPAESTSSAVGNVAGVLGSGPVDVPLGTSVDLVLAFAVEADLGRLRESFRAARRSWDSVREGEDGEAPVRFELLPNLPNPFNPSTAIRFALPQSAPVRLVIYDVRGRRVRSLLDATLESGFHRREWDGRDDEGRLVASGVYLVQLRSGAIDQSRRMVLVR